MNTIETSFIDASTGKLIGQADMPVERLPNSFHHETTMHIGDENWKVIEADPMSVEEFVLTGKLVLTLQKVITLPAKDILYTLPTICNEIPAVLSGSTREGENVLELHEDDWQQIEFISLAHHDTIDLELAKIRNIYQESSVDNGQFLGFKNIHIREQITDPLTEKISLDQLAGFFTSAVYNYEGVSYQGFDGLVDGGFAFKTSMILFYGQQIKGIVKILGIRVIEHKPVENEEIVQNFQRFMQTYNLCLVDWCKYQIIHANKESIIRFLEG